jgi:hypothetical protein
MLDLTPAQSSFLALNPHLVPVANLAGYGVETLVMDTLVTPEGNHPVYILTESCFVQSVDYWQDHNAYDNPTWTVRGHYAIEGTPVTKEVTGKDIQAVRDYMRCHYPSISVDWII